MGRVKPRFAALAARYATEVNTLGAPNDELRERKRRLDRACEAAGRDPASLGFSVMTACFVGRGSGRRRSSVFGASSLSGRTTPTRRRSSPSGATAGSSATVDEVARADRGAARGRRDARLPPAPEPHGRRDGRTRRRPCCFRSSGSVPRHDDYYELTGAEDVAWDLSDLYEGGDDPRIEADVDEADAAAAAFRERYHGKVAELSAAELADAIDEPGADRVDPHARRYFAHLYFATDMADPPRGALVARITEKGAALDTQLLFFGLEIAELDDDAAEALLAGPELERWQHWIRSLRKFRPYLLSEPEEKIVTEKTVSGVSAWGRLYEELLGALRVSLDGVEISFEEAMSKLYSSDRDVRRTAAEAVTEALESGLRTRTFIFNTILLDKSIDDRLRGYPTWISSRNLRNDTTDEAVQALVDAAVSRYDVVQRYYRLKAKLIGLDRLAFYDRMAPIGEDPSKVSWDEARDIVVGAYADFAQEAGDIAERFFSDSWIDAPVRDNKRTGAFCATTVPGVHPYVLMNFTGDRRSILTLAHELGHGLHGALVACRSACSTRTRR